MRLDANLDLLPVPPSQSSRSTLIALIVVGVLIAAIVLAILVSR